MNIEILRDPTKENCIQIESKLTTNVLVQLEGVDGPIYCPNVYGDMACFIAEATLIDNVGKKLKRLRFESEQFNKDKIADIHSMWIQFDEKVANYCKDNMNKFVESNFIPPKIKIL